MQPESKHLSTVLPPIIDKDDINNANEASSTSSCQSLWCCKKTSKRDGNPSDSGLSYSTNTNRPPANRLTRKTDALIHKSEKSYSRKRRNDDDSTGGDESTDCELGTFSTV